jgi:superfamily I DNA/RNA helicase
MYRVMFSKEFNKCLRELLKNGNHGKQSNIKVKAAQSEAATDGEITTLQRTNHGETRLPNIEKFDLGDGYRLVVQLIDGVKKSRAFLYVGCHDDTETWLDSHRNYKWIKRESDGTLEFVQYQERNEISGITSFDLDSAESYMNLPLLRHIDSKIIHSIDLNEATLNYLMQITAQRWEEDPMGLLDNIIEISKSDNEATCLYDILDLAHKKEFNKIEHRILAYKGPEHATILERDAIAESMCSDDNSETFVNYEAIQDFFGSNTEADWADWMLFLHPAQKALSQKDFNGPARLRGVSGSGKTSVLIHRAKYLARKYKQNILVLTLTESMRRLLDSLLDRLCGIERAYIHTYTVSSFSKYIIEELHEKSNRWYTNITDKIYSDLETDAINKVISMPQFQKGHWLNYSDYFKRNFIKDELKFIRSRLVPHNYSEYLKSSYKRVGREIPLNEEMRQIIYDSLIEVYEQGLKKLHRLDHEAIVQEAMSLLNSRPNQLNFRSVLVDEVQDLSQNEIVMISSIVNSDDENGIFLVGDGAQTIYKKGFSLKQAGISISSRSFSFKKNYRNTKQILKAAFSLIEKYEFADVDEDNIQKPINPELALRNGTLPSIIKAYSKHEECEYIANDIVKSINSNDQLLGSICVIGLTQAHRNSIKERLESLNVRVCELRDDVISNDLVKISTIESAKGHEFSVVYIMGLIEGVMPKQTESITLEASRMYVAMTRACDSLFITYSMNNYDKPSQLLLNIQDHCDEYEYIKGEIKSI